MKGRAHRLDELGALRQALADAAAAAAEEAGRERERAAREASERRLFASTIGPVIPLRSEVALPPPRPRPPALPRQRLKDEAEVIREAISDDFDVESLLETDEGLSFRRRGISPAVVRKLRRGVWVIQAEVDLHGLRREAAREAVAGLIRDAARQGLRCVRIVHGKGIGSPGREPVLKAKVKTWLVQKKEVLAFTHARAADGGHGALIVLLDPQARGAEPRRPLPRGRRHEEPEEPA